MDFIKKSFVKNAQSPFLIGNIDVTYEQFHQYIIKNLPLEKKNLALVSVSEGFDALLIYLACQLQSVVPIMLPEQLNENELNRYIKKYKPNYIFTKNNFKRIDKYSTKDKSSLKNDFFLYESNSSKKHNIKNTTLLLSTSGSTGDPKLVKLTENNIETNTNAIVGSLNLRKEDTATISLPLNYSFGLSVIHSHIFAGTKIIISDPSILAKSFWEDISKYDIRCLYGVPYQFEIFKKFKVFSKLPERFRFFAQAGGAMDASLTKWFLDQSIENKKDIYIMYGQTECSPRISSFNITKNPKKIGSAGRAIENCCVFLDSNSSEGELLIKGKNVFSGYAQSIDELDSEKVSNKTHHSGDIGFIDEDGFIFITGRAKRFVKIYGHNINLDHLESNLKSVYTEIAIVGRDNHITVFYTGDDKNGELLSAEIEKIKTVNARTIKVKKIGNIPRLSNKKVDYQKLEIYL